MYISYSHNTTQQFTMSSITVHTTLCHWITTGPSKHHCR